MAITIRVGDRANRKLVTLEMDVRCSFFYDDKIIHNLILKHNLVFWRSLKRKNLFDSSQATIVGNKVIEKIWA